MKASRRKLTYRISGFGHRLTVEARTRGAAVHQFRKAVNQNEDQYLGGAPKGIKQIQPRPAEDGTWPELAIEVLTPPDFPECIIQHHRPEFIPSQTKVSRQSEPLAKGLHPDTAKPTPKWGWVFHSAGNDGGRKPIMYGHAVQKVA